MARDPLTYSDWGSFAPYDWREEEARRALAAGAFTTSPAPQKPALLSDAVSGARKSLTDTALSLMPTLPTREQYTALATDPNLDQRIVQSAKRTIVDPIVGSGKGLVQGTSDILEGRGVDPGKYTFDIMTTVPLGGAAFSMAAGAERGAAGMLRPTKPVVAKPKLVVAHRKPDGSLLYGEPGEVHGNLANRTDFFPDNEGDIGWAIHPDGPFMQRPEAIDFVNRFDPETSSRLDRSARSGRLEANDYNVASGDYVNAPPLVDLPTEAKVPGFGSFSVGPHAPARQAALDYMKAKGLPYRPERKYQPVDPERAARVADEFERMPHNPNDPEVAASYDALTSEVADQWKEIEKTGLKVEFIKPGQPNPYKASPRLAHKDIAENNHLWVFPTEYGFGDELFAKYSKDAPHPMLKDSGVVVDGRKLQNNDLFRIVHDYFGHAKEGVGFRATGEDNAFRQHRAMFTPLAQRALTTETRGQNSWLNYGPHGAKNRTAKGDDTVFADQKVGLMPQWTTLYANSKNAAPLSLSAAIDFDNMRPIGEAVDDPFGKVYGAQTVRNPVRNIRPGIYGDPRDIARAASQNVDPEHESLFKLFGVTRDDLYEMSGRGTRQGNITPEIGGAGRSKLAQQVTTPENAQRLVDILGEAGKYPELIKGMDAWYTMDPAFQRLVQLVGPEEAVKRYNKLNAYTSMASPSSEVPIEINRGTAANWLSNEGRFEDFADYVATGGDFRGAPADLIDFQGHPHGRQAHLPGMQRYNETGIVSYDPEIVKVPLYHAASGVPETGFQTTLPVPDAHFTRGLGVPDVKTAEVTKDVALKRNIYGPVGPWYRQNVAEPLGLQAVPTQARQWGTMAHLTGVKTKIGAPKLELLARNIWKRAKKRHMNPHALRDRVLLGQDFAANPAAAAPLSLYAGWDD